MMNNATITAEYLIRFFICLISVYQILVVHSEHGNFCVHYLGTLRPEARWFHAIVIISGFKNVLFLVWECTSIYAKKESEGYDVISDYDTDDENVS